MGEESKQRIIQEYVPGKQVTLAHIIANPNEDIYKKLGLIVDKKDAIGILTITPSEASIIAADVATKASGVSLGFIALNEVLDVLGNILNFSSTKITRT